MDQSGQRISQRERNKQFIIKSERKFWREILVFTFTVLVWVYSIAVIYFFADALLSLNHRIPRLLRIIFKMNAEDVRSFTLLGFIIFIAVYILLYGWSYYNKRRFGNLNRRVYPKSATKEDMLELDMIDESIYEELQKMKEITFESNPIRRKKR